MYSYVKRILDILLSFLGIMVFSPIFLVITILIKLDSKGPVFFRQNRVGKHKKLFKIYKFRTMKQDTPKYVPTGSLTDANDHITRLGHFLRKTSLDELPQLINILKGDMSIVGPRPLISEDKEVINERDKYKANDILPGLTGWAQVNGRDTLPPKEKARLDGYYVEHMSFSFDIKCVWITILSVLKAKDIVEGHEQKVPKNDKHSADCEPNMEQKSK